MKIALIGYGKMGKAIEEIAVSKGHEVLLKISSHNLSDFTKENLQKADVAIEFTNPHSAFENVMKCIGWKIPVVCGSTGWLEKFAETIKSVELNNVAFLYASNFSVGVNIFFEVNKKLSQLMSGQS
ncbi:MAG: 4-hydroxy-tetrahydrodipicolinate reductase, partial [Bacteroidota bacterium]